jgi:hypothetical protein
MKMKNYTAKIEYYTFQVNKAIQNLDTKALQFYTTKLTYFMERQKFANRETMIFGLHAQN